MDDNLLARQFVQRAISARAELAMLEAEIKLLNARHEALRSYIAESDRLAERLAGERSAVLTMARAVNTNLQDVEDGLFEAPAELAALANPTKSAALPAVAEASFVGTAPATIAPAPAQPTPSAAAEPALEAAATAPAMAPGAGAPARTVPTNEAPTAAQPAPVAATPTEAPGFVAAATAGAADQPTERGPARPKARPTSAAPAAAAPAQTPERNPGPKGGDTAAAETELPVEPVQRGPSSRERAAMQVPAILDRHRQGLGVSAIARELGLDPKTVRKYITAGLAPAREPAPAPDAVESASATTADQAPAADPAPSAATPAEMPPAAAVAEADPKARRGPGRQRAAAAPAPAAEPVSRGLGQPKKASPAPVSDDAAPAPVDAAVMPGVADEAAPAAAAPSAANTPDRAPRATAAYGARVSGLRGALDSIGSSAPPKTTRRGKADTVLAAAEDTPTTHGAVDDTAPARAVASDTARVTTAAAPAPGASVRQMEDAILSVLRDQQSKLVAIGEIADRTRKRLGDVCLDIAPGSILEGLRKNGLVERVGHKWRISQNADELRALFKH